MKGLDAIASEEDGPAGREASAGVGAGERPLQFENEVRNHDDRLGAKLQSRA